MFFVKSTIAFAVLFGVLIDCSINVAGSGKFFAASVLFFGAMCAAIACAVCYKAHKLALTRVEEEFGKFTKLLLLELPPSAFHIAVEEGKLRGILKEKAKDASKS